MTRAPPDRLSDVTASAASVSYCPRCAQPAEALRVTPHTNNEAVCRACREHALALYVLHGPFADDAA